MIIQVKIKLDRNQLPYWSALLTQEGEGILEVRAKRTMNPRNHQQLRDNFTEVLQDVLDKILKQPDADSIVRLLIQEEIPVTNKPRGG